MPRQSPITKTINQVTREYAKEQKQAKVQQEKLKREKEKEAKRLQKEIEIKMKENSINIAKQITEKSRNQREEILSLLKNINSHKETINWEILKEQSNYDRQLELKKLPIKPLEENYKIKLKLIDYIIPNRVSNLENKSKNQYEEALNKWEVEYKNIEKENNKKVSIWEDGKKAFENRKYIKNNNIDKLKKEYEEVKKEGVEFYITKILSKRKYPSYYKITCEIEYMPLNKILIVECDLPQKEKIPNLKERRYEVTKKCYKDILLKETDINKVYEESLYQLCLRLNYDIYMSDISNNIEGIVFNGYLTELNKSNGLEERNCILSLQTSVETFMECNLSKVDPKSCFKRMKGRAGTQLSDLVAVAPICNISNYDKRFIKSHEIGDKIKGYNLASMHWEDFEHLIRELFEKEYAKDNVEVHVTQGIKDGGVDGVIIDLDPIKGGKIIIQAKRYTNIVGISAVRELATVVSDEGAMKGILVTTSDFGRDSYEYVKDKPLTLLNGENLLHMLKKHGYEARIDLNEAKLEIKEQSKYNFSSKNKTNIK